MITRSTYGRYTITWDDDFAIFASITPYQQSVYEAFQRQLEEQNRKIAEQLAGQCIPPPPPDTLPSPPPNDEEPEVTPIPKIRRRKCYVCGHPDAVARRVDEPAYCEEHRRK